MPKSDKLLIVLIINCYSNHYSSSSSTTQKILSHVFLFKNYHENNVKIRFTPCNKYYCVNERKCPNRQ